MKLNNNNLRVIWAVFTIAILTLTACTGNPQSVPAQTTATGMSAPNPTAAAGKTLVVCLGQEPDSLYLYGNSSRAMWSVLESIYDGPIDTVNYEPSPVILTQLPTIENGGVLLEKKAVTEGDEVANTEGDLVALKKGVRVFPEGCTSNECSVEWDGVSPLTVNQMVANFTLLTGLKWSDGTPLTAADSVFSYTVAADPATKVSKNMVNRTESYTAVDNRTVEWKGITGYLTLNPSAFFWVPLPSHLLNSITADEMNTSELTNKNPVGWGPYQIDEWVKGDHIRLVKNPNYFRGAEGLPKFDVVVYRFIQTLPETDLSSIVTGECDIIDTSAGLENQIQPIRALELDGKAKSYFGMGPEWEALSFGIKPATYDEVYNPYEDRPDFFSDVRVRQAFANCIDREKINTRILYRQSKVPETFLSPNHPYAVTDVNSYIHDTALGGQLLEEVGWKDTDGDTATPRESLGVKNVMDGTEFSMSYYVTESELHAAVTETVVESMAECGIKVTPTYLSVNDLYAAGPEGKIFGRNFDLVELAWSTGRVPPCFLYTSSEIPTEKNNWLGTKFGGVNFTGYSNDAYDVACSEMLTAGLNKETVSSQNEVMQKILSEDLPVLPLFYHIKAMISRPDLCGLSLDVTSRSSLRNIESLDIAAACPAE